MFFSDQQRWDTTGVHGNPMGLTPNFDRLALNGTHCFNAFTPQPVCVPARLVLQTGRYASQYKTYNNAGGLPAGAKTLGSYFRDAGYNTGYIGKWHLCDENRFSAVPEDHRGGYEYWLAANVLEFTSDAYRVRLFDNDDKAVDLPGYRVDALVDAAIRYVTGNRDRPFFLFCSFVEPHFQNSRDDYPAPTGYEERYLDPWTPPDLRALGGSAPRHLPGYYGMIKRLDEGLGRLQDALLSLELIDDTIMVCTTDHGCHFKTRNSEYKRSCHDSSLRIPMAFGGPAFEGGGRIQNLVSLIDVPPTLLDACDIPVPPEMQGSSVLPLTNGEQTAWPEEVYSEIYETYLSRCARTRRWKYSVRKTEPGAGPGRSWRFIEDCLYDLKADPYELNNLIGFTSHKKVAEIMKARLVRRMREAGEPNPEIMKSIEKKGGQKAVSGKDAEL